MPLQRPNRTSQSNRQKRLATKPARGELSKAASGATYFPSEYHCRLPDGRPRRIRAKPASICPREWTTPEANEALRHAIMRGRVSETWEDGFPRYVWYREGHTIYEARHTRGPHGTYHAYPIDLFEAPLGLIP